MSCIHDLGATSYRCQWQATGDSLSGGDDVRNDTFVVASKPGAGSGKASLNLVSDKDNSIVGTKIRQGLQEARRRNHKAAFTLDGFNH